MRATFRQIQLHNSGQKLGDVEVMFCSVVKTAVRSNSEDQLFVGYNASITSGQSGNAVEIQACPRCFRAHLQRRRWVPIKNSYPPATPPQIPLRKERSESSKCWILTLAGYGSISVRNRQKLAHIVTSLLCRL